jgi:eukaryotic-like serine/threonine-protein kinase
MGEQDGSTSFQPGTVLAGTPHLVRRELGSGGVGTVYETCRLDTGERRAVKVLSRHAAHHPTLQERFLHETEVLSALCSPHIVGVHGSGRLATGEAFYEMDLLEGETLRDLLGRGPLDPSFACGLVYQALGALHEVHLAGLVHRDVKPENLFLCADGRCVLLDFGAVKILTDQGRFSPRRFPTDQGKTFGTTRYLPPEAGFLTPDARADIYAVGVVLAELLAGVLPLAHLDAGEYLEWVDACGFPMPNDLPEALLPVLECATATAFQHRYPSAAAFAAALARACQEAGIDLVGVRPLPRAPRPTPSPLQKAALAAAPALEPSAERASPEVASPAAPVRSWRARRVPLASAIAFGVTGFAAGAAVSFTTPSWVGPLVAMPVAPELPREAPAGRIAPASAPAAPALEPPAEPQPREASPPAVSPSAPVSSALPPSAPARPVVRSSAPASSARGDQRAQLEAKLRSGRGTTDDAEALAGLCRKTGDERCRRLVIKFVERGEGR